VGITDVRVGAPDRAVQAGQHVVAQRLALGGRAAATRAVIDPAVRAGRDVHGRVHADDRGGDLRELRAGSGNDAVRRARRRAVGGGAVGLDIDPEARVVNGSGVTDVLPPQQVAGLGID